jgi:hypothetical protein
VTTPIARGSTGQRFFPIGLKKTLSFQLGLELQELLEQVALPRLPHGLHDQLQLSARLINTQAPPQLDQLAVTRRKVQQAGRTAKHGAANLPLLVLEGKIAMPTGRPRKTADFALHSHRVETRLQAVRDRAQQRAHRPDTNIPLAPTRNGFSRMSRFLKHG